MKFKRGKKIITMMILIELLLSAFLLPSIVHADDTVIIDIESIHIPPGETMNSSIKILNIENFGSCDLSVSYDPSILEVVNVTDGDMSEFYYYVDNTQGLMNITAYSLESLTSDSIQICDVSFRAKNTTNDGEVTVITLKKIQLLSAEPFPYDIAHVVNNGTVTIETNLSQTIVEIEDIYIIDDENGTTNLTISNIENLGSIMVSLSFDSDLVSVVDVIKGDLDGIDFYVDNSAGWVNISGYVMDSFSDDFLSVASIVFQATSSAEDGDVGLLFIEESELLSADPTPTFINHTKDHGLIYIIDEGQQNESTIVTIDDVNIIENTTGTTELTIANVENLGSAVFQIIWDPMIVEITNISNTEFDTIDYYIDNTQGVLNILVYSIDFITSDLIKVTDITFQAKSQASSGDGTDLLINNSLLLTATPIPDLISHQQVHGYISIIEAPKPAVIIDDVTIVQDGTEETNLKITDIVDLGSCELEIRWDPDIAMVTNVAEGDFDSIISYVNNTQGILTINAFSIEPITDDEITLAMITFKAIANASNSTLLQIENSTLLSASPIPEFIDHDQIDGLLFIVSPMELMVDSGGPYTGKINKDVTLQATASGGVPPYEFTWDLDDDGSYDDATGDMVIIQWENTGTWTISVQAMDNATPSMIAQDTTTVKITEQSSGGSSGGSGGGSSGGVVSNTRPTAVAQVTPTQATVNELISYDASGSTDDGSIQSFSWNFGDGSTGVGLSTTHRYSEMGTYLVTLTVTDDLGATDTIDAPITVTITQANNPPSQPAITGPSSGKKNIPLTFSVTLDDPDGEDGLSLIVDWDDDTPDTILSDINNGETVTVSHSWSDYGLYTMMVRSRDASNATSNTQMLTIAIDVHQIDGEITGFLIDEDSDDVYDLYQDDQTGNQTMVSNHNDSWYLIDVDDDGQWDYDYDVLTGTLNTYEAADTSDEDNTGLCLLIALIIVIFVVLAYIIYKKEKDRKERLEQEKKEEEERKRKEEEKKKAEEQKKKEEEKKAKKNKEKKATDEDKPKKKKTTKKTKKAASKKKK